MTMSWVLISRKIPATSSRSNQSILLWLSVIKMMRFSYFKCLQWSRITWVATMTASSTAERLVKRLSSTRCYQLPSAGGVSLLDVLIFCILRSKSRLGWEIGHMLVILSYWSGVVSLSTLYVSARIDAAWESCRMRVSLVQQALTRSSCEQYRNHVCLSSAHDLDSWRTSQFVFYLAICVQYQFTLSSMNSVITVKAVEKSLDMEFDTFNTNTVAFLLAIRIEWYDGRRKRKYRPSKWNGRFYTNALILKNRLGTGSNQRSVDCSFAYGAFTGYAMQPMIFSVYCYMWIVNYLIGNT